MVKNYNSKILYNLKHISQLHPKVQRMICEPNQPLHAYKKYLQRQQLGLLVLTSVTFLLPLIDVFHPHLLVTNQVNQQG